MPADIVFHFAGRYFLHIQLSIDALFFRFLNQLLLLVGSGMVLTDALRRIADGYMALPPKEQNYFTESFTQLWQESARTGESLLAAFRRFSRFSHVKELNRVTGILEENQTKGSALWEKLQEQSEALWTARKQITLARIRMAESKMSFPLGIFLIALIMMTAAPAMLQM